MTVSVSHILQQYVNLGQPTYTFDFPIKEATDLQVRFYDGEWQDLVKDINYTVATALDSITLINPDNYYGATNKLLIKRARPYLQPTDYVLGDKFPAAATEGALDDLSMQIQQLAFLSDRTIRFDEADTEIQAIPGTSRTEKFLFFDENGNPTLVSGTPSQPSITIRQEAVASMDQTVFSTDQSYTPGAGNLIVFLNGVMQVAGQDYLESNSTTVTFASPLADGEQVTFLFGLLSETVSVVNRFKRTPQELAIGVMPIDDSYPPGHFHRYGAKGDGITDDAVAMQTAFNLPHKIQSEPETTYYTSQPLTFDRNYAIWEANRCTITTDKNITAITVGKTGGSTSNVMRDTCIKGFPRVVCTYPSPTNYGWLLRQCNQCEFELSADGFWENIRVQTTTAGFAYNTVKIGYLRKPRYVNLHVQPIAPGWVNENTFEYGRYSADGDAGVLCHIWVEGDGAGNGWPNNNVFLHPSLEGGSSGTIDWAIIEEGLSNRYISPRIEITVSNSYPLFNTSKPTVLITAEAEACYFDTGWYDTAIYNLGKGTSIKSAQINRMSQRGSNVAFYGGPALQLTRQFAGIAESAGGHPMLSLEDSYEGAGTSQTYRSVLSRYNVTGSYHFKGVRTGDPVHNLGRQYECLTSHTSTIDTQPGVGANWRLYWAIKDTTAGTANAWATSVAYTGRQNMFLVDGNGAVLKQTHRSGTAAPTANANYIGEIFVDTTNSKAYMAKSVGSGASDWMVLN